MDFPQGVLNSDAKRRAITKKKKKKKDLKNARKTEVAAQVRCPFKKSFYALGKMHNRF